MKILITGATGFVGVNAVEFLLKKHSIRILVRNKNKAKRLFGDSVYIFEGNILDYESIRKSVHGCNCVIHIAGLIKSYDKERLYDINKNGAANVARAAKEEGINNVIYLSSLAARGPDDKNIPVSHYGYSKRLGEYGFMKYLYNANLKILRPPIIYGPFEREFFTLFKTAQMGFLPVLDDRLFSFVYVKDLVSAIDRLIDVEADYPKVYYVSDGNKYFWSEVADVMFDVLNVKNGAKLKLSPFFANIIAYTTYFMKDKAPFTLDKINEIKANGWTCGYEDLKNDTGFEPEYDIKKGFRETLKWYKENEWL